MLGSIFGESLHFFMKNAQTDTWTNIGICPRIVHPIVNSYKRSRSSCSAGCALACRLTAGNCCVAPCCVRSGPLERSQWPACALGAFCRSFWPARTRFCSLGGPFGRFPERFSIVFRLFLLLVRSRNAKGATCVSTAPAGSKRMSDTRCPKDAAPKYVPLVYI